MNHIKLQQDILKARDAEDRRGKRFPFSYGLTGKSIYVCVNHNYFVVIPSALWYLDSEKVFSTIPLNLDYFCKAEEGTVSIYETGLIRTLPDGRKVKQFSSEKFDVYVDEDILKYFGKDVTDYRAINEKSLVYLYEYDRLVGIVCPVNMGGKGE